jgi:hypothetical protein
MSAEKKSSDLSAQVARTVDPLLAVVPEVEGQRRIIDLADGRAAEPDSTAEAESRSAAEPSSTAEAERRSAAEPSSTAEAESRSAAEPSSTAEAESRSAAEAERQRAAEAERRRAAEAERWAAEAERTADDELKARGIDPQRVKQIEIEAQKLGDQAAEILIDDEQQQTRVFERLVAIGKSLSNLQRNISPLETVAAAEFEIKAIRSIITKRLRIDSEQKRIRYLVPGLILIYTGLLIFIIYCGYHIKSDSLTLPIIGIPVYVLVWGGIGSLAAILYRFYTQEIGRMSQEFRWLIARPIIGIIMGSIAYLGVVSGMLILSTSNGTTGTVREEIVWLLAFLGGFSDRFFESVIAALLARVPVSAEPEKARG